MSTKSIVSSELLRQLPAILEMRDGDEIYLKGHRITLEHLCFYYREGYSAEMLREQFPTLSLLEIHKVIVFYLENRITTDDYLSKCQAARDANFEHWQRTERTSPDIEELRRRVQLRQKLPGNTPS